MNTYAGHQFGYNGRIMYADVDEFTSDGSVMEIHSRHVSEVSIFESNVALYVSRAAYSNTDDLVYKSNFDSLLRDFPNMLVKVWDMGGELLALDVTGYDPEDEEWGPLGERGNLLNILIGLDDDYPLYDEDDYTSREWVQFENDTLDALDWAFRRSEYLSGLNYTDVDNFWESDVKGEAFEIVRLSHNYYPETPDEDVLVDAILDAVQIVFWGAVNVVQEENSDPLF